MKSFLLTSGPYARFDSFPIEALQQRSRSQSIQRYRVSEHELWISGEDHAGETLPFRDESSWRAFKFTQRTLKRTKLFPRDLERSLGHAAPDAAIAIIRATLSEYEEEASWLFISEAFGAWFLFRDPLGLCPLYVFDDGATLAITNTYRSLLPLLENAELDHEVLAEIATSSFPFDAARTGYKALRRVPAGSYWSRVGDRQQVDSWWTYEEEPLRMPSWADTLQEYRGLLARSVEDRLDNCPIILELSGGLDSSNIAAVASFWTEKHAIQAITWQQTARSEDDPEVVFATQTARRLRIPHTCLLMDDGPRNLPSAPWGNFGPVHLSEQFGSGPAVVLSGHGGDSLFRVRQRDIDRTAKSFSLRQLRNLWLLHKELHGSAPPLFLRHRLLGGRVERVIADRKLPWIPESLHETLAQSHNRATSNLRETGGREAMTSQSNWATIFEISDPGFTGTNLQWRFPYFELPLIRLVDSLPAAPYLLDKMLARHAWKERLPSTVIERPKTLSLSQDADLPAANEFKAWMNSSRTLKLQGSSLDLAKLNRLIEAPERFPRWSRLSARNAVNVVRWFAEYSDFGKI